MLVITRRRDEWIRIGPGTTVKVLRIGSNTVKIGIEAPQGIDIVRGELLATDQPVFTAGTKGEQQ